MSALRRNLFVAKFVVALKIGPANIFRFFWYKLRVKLPFFLSNLSRVDDGAPWDEDFFLENNKREPSRQLPIGPLKLFGVFELPLHCPPPDWFVSVIDGNRFDADKPWWSVADFDSNCRDIKGVWELSRFEWVMKLMQHSIQGDDKALFFLNSWLRDWRIQNRPYYGVNWKCGQEASIRVLHLAAAALMTGQPKNVTKSLMRLIKEHLFRIDLTVGYALAQDNNHGTSEAAALFVGGSWLAMLNDHSAMRWEKKGRRLLEDRASHLIGQDGSFSQYSLNYHRVVLDTYTFVEVWRRSLSLKPFSDLLLSRLRAATAWLANMIASPDGDAPNIGTNDGAQFFQLACTGRRDYRPSVQMASVVFNGKRAYRRLGSWDEPMDWFGINHKRPTGNYLRSCQYDDGGFAVLRQRSIFLAFRYPRFQFRPSQSDLLHLDIWYKGDNWIRDAGSFSYNTAQPWQDYFRSVEAHNTIQFDGRDQMPKLGRFLFGAWPKVREFRSLEKVDEMETIAAGYKDWLGASHRRVLQLSKKRVLIVDQVTGFSDHAVLRWRLLPGHWFWQGEALCMDGVSISVSCTSEISRQEIVQGWESRYYTQRTPLPVLEVEIRKPGTFTTEIKFRP